MKKIALLAVILALLPATAHATAPATCAITGVVYDGAGNPVPNATIYFNSQNTQVVNGSTIYPILKSSTTDANGNLSTTALTQGLFVQITICQLQGGGCAAPTTGFVPITTTTTFQNLLSGQLVVVGSALSGNLNASGYRIYNLGANTTTGDALSQGVSVLNNLATATGNYPMGGFKLTGLGAGTGSGDSLAYGLNTLNNLATATGNYPMGTNKLTGLGAGTTSGDSLAYGLNGLNSLGAATGNYAMGGYKFTGLAAGTTSGDSLAFGLNDLSQLATATGNYSMGGNVLFGVGQLIIPSSAFASPGGIVIQETVSENGSGAIGYYLDLTNTTGALTGVAVDGTGSTGTTKDIVLGLNNNAGSTGLTVNGGVAGQSLILGTFGSAPSAFVVSSYGVAHPSSTIGNLPSCSSTTVGYLFTVTNSDSACSFNSTPAHSSCTVGTNCYTCQVQCAEAGSTSYAWIAY